MNNRQVRNALPAVYAIAIVLALLVGGGTVLVAVAVVGAMIVGAGYALTSGGVSSSPERAARRAGRRNRRS